MNVRIVSTLAVVCMLLVPAICRAEKGTDLSPTLAKAGKQVVNDSLDRAELGQDYVMPKGTWKIADGAIAGSEKAEDDHAAVLMLAKPNHDSIIQFSFKLDGTDGFSLSYNYAKGHLFRVVIHSDSIVILTDKDKKDPASKSVTLVKESTSFEQGKWYTLLVEVVGDKVAVQADNGAKATASHPSLDTNKTGYRFVMRGQTLHVDDIKAWTAEK